MNIISFIILLHEIILFYNQSANFSLLNCICFYFKDIDAMVKKYIEEDETIILNVLSADQESANSKSLKFSTEKDPKHERTLLVITKIDLADNKQLFINFSDFQNGKNAFPDGHVFLVRNRTFKENQSESKIDLSEVRQREKAFFDAEEMNEFPGSCKGSQALSQKLSEMQTKRMLIILPKLKKKINDKYLHLKEVRKQLPTVFQTEHECRVLLCAFYKYLY